MNKDKTHTVRLDPKTYQLLQYIKKAEDRSIISIVRMGIRLVMEKIRRPNEPK